MTAREMFEKLEYDYMKTEFEIFYYYAIRTYGDDTDYIGIHFRLDDNTISTDVTIDMQELQAINKQVEELGWNNGKENRI